MNKKIIFPILGVALLSGSLLGYQSLVQADAPNNVNINVSQDIKLDQKLMQTAQDKLKELTGNTYTLIQGTATKDSIHLKRENFKDDIIAYKANGKLETISIKINYEDLNGGKYQTKLKETWAALFPGEEPKYVNISESIYYVGTISSNAMQNKQIYMQENGEAYGVNYAPDDAPASVQKEADLVLSKLTDGKVKQGTELNRMFVRDGKPNVYQYKYKSEAMEVSFAIEEQTLELLQADVNHTDGKGVDSYEEFQEREKEKSAKIKKLTLDTLMKNAMKDAKTMLDLDLKGYKGARGANAWDEDYMTFTKEGAPSVSARFNKDGSFRSFTIDKYDQEIDFYGMTIVGPPNEELKLLID
jgi:ribosomal protein L5